MKRLAKEKPKYMIRMECGFGCLINIKTVQKFTHEEEWILFEKEMDSHNKIFHNFELDAKIVLK